ncbi:MAG: SUMF1/EgtB/PvdO family nonheme iron enzyme [Pseudomonadota bacterium]|nr:SUMF1/EgtB/PvdO family nonheme iron enzyme [Pseudomonadota bacterium]
MVRRHLSGLIWVLALAIAVVATAPVAHAERRVALVIGNASYDKSPDLRNPVNDARAMAKRLKELGFELIDGQPHENVTRIQMARLVRKFSSEVGRDDTALLFYAGHGIGAHGTNWMVPVDDRDIQTALDLPDFAVSVSSLMERLERRQGGTNLILLDACRDNPLPADTRSSGASRGLGQMSAPSGSFVAYAADPGQVAFDGEGNNGLFTESLLQSLTRPDRPLYEIMREVRREVRRKTNGAQTPWTEESLDKEFFFAEPAAPEVRVAALQPAQTSQIASPPAAAPAPQVSGWLSAPAPQQPQQVYVQPAAPAQAETRVASATLAPAIPQPVRPALPPVNAELLKELVGEMVTVRGGSFRVMEADSSPGQNVQIGRDFGIGKFEITFDQWDACVDAGGCNGYRPADDGEGRGKRPVMRVDWHQVQTFIDWANGRLGLTGRPDRLRLPTEAEWEFAARGGSSDTFFFGSDQDQLCKYANVMDYYGGRYFPMFAASAIDCDDDYVRPAPVGKYRPNSLGIHDMLGNVSEWTQDCWSPTYSTVPTDGSALVIAECDYHVARGGSWMVTPKNMGDRTRAYRGTETLGFRVARTLP